MLIAGIDYSTHSVDIVTIPYDEPGTPVWRGYPLQGSDAFDRARHVAETVPGRASSFWDGILAVAIEHPAGRNGTGHMLRIQGAVLSCIPARMLVHPMPPAKWKKLAGLPGNANHDTYVRQSVRLLQGGREDRWLDFDLAQWPEDAHAAHLMTRALRVLLDRQEVAT